MQSLNRKDASFFSRIYLNLILTLALKKRSIMKNRIVFSLLITALILIVGCSQESGDQGSEEYIASINTWHQNRITRLKKENGWLSLVGLYWLKEGENTFGTAKNNDVVFPLGSVPDYTGKFILDGDSVVVSINGGITVANNGRGIAEMKLVDDIEGKQSILTYGSYNWYLVKRGDRYGIRLKNYLNPLIENFEGIERFPVDSSWRISAKTIKYNPPKEIIVPSIIGTQDVDTAFYALQFTKDSKTYSLDPVIEGNELFVIFADETSGVETYGAGRFLYADKPNADGIVILDFNKAYNPPCNFTKFATCPLPPKSNYLKLRITAGEKKYHEAGE